MTLKRKLQFFSLFTQRNEEKMHDHINQRKKNESTFFWKLLIVHVFQELKSTGWNNGTFLNIKNLSDIVTLGVFM